MVSLAATIGNRRVYYPRPAANLPDILMVENPQRFASKRRSLKRFHPIIVETVEEQSELEAFLAQERDLLVPPDLLDERPSTLVRKHLTIAHYRPSEPGWPFVQLCQWPAHFAAKTASSDRLFARGAYTFELFGDRQRLEKASKALLASVDRRHAFQVEIVFPDWSPDPDASPN